MVARTMTSDASLSSAPAQAVRRAPASYRSCSYASPVGMLTLAAADDGLKGLWIEGQKYFAGTLDAPLEEGMDAHLERACTWLDAYFAGNAPALDALTLAPIGSAFRQTVWRILCEIPYGCVRTYGDVAKEAAARLGKARMSAQATGGAVGHNPISIIIPCHRVVGADGSLTGYAGGISKKLALLQAEGVDVSAFHVPQRSTAP